jgi:hypothetical protein
MIYLVSFRDCTIKTLFEKAPFLKGHETLEYDECLQLFEMGNSIKEKRGMIKNYFTYKDE